MFSNATDRKWNEKPVMCEDRKTVQKLLRDKGELLIMSGVQLTKVRDPDEANGLSPIPALPLKVYVNLETKTYTITETHPIMVKCVFCRMVKILVLYYWMLCNV